MLDSGAEFPQGRQRVTSDNDELTETFKEFDYDGDGYITAVEFKLAMTARHEQVTGDEIDSIFDHADNDRDGKIDLAEFTKAWNS
jgi:Ca2+-binding EF-hand superfamily protein